MSGAVPGTPVMRAADAPVALGRRRLKVLSVVFALAFASIGIRLVDMVVSTDPRLVLARGTGSQAPETRRADITDRNGELLATNLLVPSIFADPGILADPPAASKALARVLKGVDPVALQGRLATAAAKGRRFVWVKHQVTPAEQKAVLDLGIPGVDFRFNEQRIYPKQNLASHLVGFVDLDNRGLAGIERAFDERLTGKDGSTAEPLALSIDLRLQQIVRQELSAAVRRFRPQGAVGIVSDRSTGEVLAMVSLPDYDPNHVDQASEDQRFNRATGMSYELGSLFKVFTTAMALDSGEVSLQDSFDATAPLRIGRYAIRDSHPERRWLTVPEVFMLSSNIGTARMAFAAGGADPERAFLKKLGLMQRPDVEMPARELAFPQLPSRWPDITTATVSFGHGIAVAPLSFVDAMGSVVGDGMRASPTLLRRDPTQPIARERMVSRRTAQEMELLMWLTVQKGTGMQARVPGYLVGGKTGTADRVDHARKAYFHNSVLASFSGVFPMEDPRYVVLVMLDDPKGDAGTYNLRYGAWTAAPVVREIIARAGPLLGVPPSTSDADMAMASRLVVTERVDQVTLRKERRVAVVAAPR